MNIDERKIDETLPIPWSQLRIVLGIMLAAALVILVYIFQTGQSQAAEESFRDLYRQTATTEQRQALLSRSKSTPTAALLWLQLAREFQDKKEFENAITTYTEFENRFPTHTLKPTAQYGKAISQLYAGKKQEALSTLIGLGSTRSESPYASLALIQAARITLEQGNPSEARRLLREIQEFYPQSQAAFEAQYLLSKLPPEAQATPPPPSNPTIATPTVPASSSLTEPPQNQQP